MRQLRWAVVLLAALAAAAGCAAGTRTTVTRSAGSSPSSSAAVAGHGWTRSDEIHWIIARSAVNLLGSAGGSSTALTKRVFDTPRTNEMGKLRSGWSVSPTKTFPSFATFAAAAAGLPTGSWVIYDNEDWSFTPAVEQHDPGKYMAAFVALAHRHRLRVILTPAMNIVNAMPCRNASEPVWRNYLEQCRVPSLVAAARPDAFEIQAQGLEDSVQAASNCGCYAWFVSQAATQARFAESAVTVYAGLSTNHSGHVSTGATLYQDATATRGVVVGYWLNVPTHSPRCPRCTPSGDPQVGIDFLHLLGY